MKPLIAILLLAAAALAQGSATTTVPSSNPAGGQPAASANQEPGVRKARLLLDQMVEALGGQAYLNLQDMEQRGLSYGFSHGDPAGGGIPFWRFWKWPDKDRTEVTKQRDIISVINGDQGYEITFKGTAAADAEALQDYLRRRHYSLEQVVRTWLNQPGSALFYEGPAMAANKPAESVTVMNAQNEAVTIYINADTHLPVRKTFTWRDPKTRERDQEAEVYDHYRLVQGIMTPFSTVREKNGLVTNQRFITFAAFNQGLADSLFQASVTYDPLKPPPRKKK